MIGEIINIIRETKLTPLQYGIVAVLWCAVIVPMLPVAVQRRKKTIFGVDSAVVMWGVLGLIVVPVAVFF